MDTKVNYTLVGFFVFSFTIGLVVFLLWMAKYGFEEKKFDRYTIVVVDSVSGLNIESPVKFRGVEVGKVTAIGIDATNSELINVNIDVQPKTPIKQDSLAVLTAQGITGLSYIELKGGTKNSPRLQAGGKIPTGKSLFDKLEYSATNVTEGIVHTLKRVDALLSDRNIQQLNGILKQLNFFVVNLNTVVEKKVPLFLSQNNAENISKSLNSMANTANNLEKESKNIGKLLQTTTTLEKTIEKTLHDYSNLSNDLSKLSIIVKQRFESGEFDVRQMTEHHLDTLNALLVELQMLSNQTNEVLKQLKNSPSDLLFKQEIIKLGPGE